jgi:hypothetical protein
VLAALSARLSAARPHREQNAVSQSDANGSPLIRLEAWIGQEGHV